MEWEETLLFRFLGAQPIHESDENAECLTNALNDIITTNKYELYFPSESEGEDN